MSRLESALFLADFESMDMDDERLPWEADMMSEAVTKWGLSVDDLIELID